jgi:hypothetical protein
MCVAPQRTIPLVVTSFPLTHTYVSIMYILKHAPSTNHPNKRFLYMYNRAVKLDPDFGDAWAYFCRFEQQHGTEVI